jgi:hypothetical protein
MKILLLINVEASSSTLVENLATHDKKKNTEQSCNENMKLNNLVNLRQK